MFREIYAAFLTPDELDSMIGGTDLYFSGAQVTERIIAISEEIDKENEAQQELDARFVELQETELKNKASDDINCIRDNVTHHLETSGKRESKTLRDILDVITSLAQAITDAVAVPQVSLGTLDAVDDQILLG